MTDRRQKPAFLECSALLCLVAALSLFAVGQRPPQSPPTRSASPAGSQPASPTVHRSDPYTRSGYDHFYNMDYDAAVKDFELAFKAQPDDPFAAYHLLTAVLFREMNRMGLIDPSAYANDTFINQPHRPPDPKVQARINELVRTAFALSEKRLAANPNDTSALYARGATRGLRSTYTALVERSWFAALRSAVGARRDNERVLELDPQYTDAKMVVGIHNYVIGSLPLAVKVAASMVGLGGSKSRGIDYLYEVANHGGDASVDAKVALALFLRREKRFDEALKLVRSLSQSYPRNFVFAIEEPDLLRLAGNDQAAADQYRNLYQQGKAGRFPNGHYELAALNLGEVLRKRKDYQGAADAYNLVDQVPQPDPEIQQKANLAAGEMYDLLQKRELAVKKYQAVVAENSASPPADAARKHIREAYRE
ncbi:MAG TPA: tetratricopeptide repeat protein [Terriglobales bacterium]|nr:tetratricopeptide repeat protein [Terriglobales bacterium]